ncbi:MAG: ArnT family glycosyltransferase [Pseudanabaenaceae cyanobacterium]
MKALRQEQGAIALLGWGLLWRGLIAALLPAGFDEAYYTAYVRYPHLSYFDHPLGVAWTLAMGAWWPDFPTPFSIRLGSLALYTGTLIFLFLTADRLFGRSAARWTLAIATAIPFFGVGFGILVLPDSPLMFFWSLCLWVCAQEFFGEETYRPTGRIVAIGALVGFACLGKYHGFLLGAGLVGFCLLSGPHRRVWQSPWLIGAAIAFAIVLAPLLIWNHQHEWVSFRFQGARAVPEGGYRLGDLLLTFLVGNGYLFPTFGFPLWWTTLRQTWMARQAPDGAKVLWIACLSVPIFLGFTVMGGYRQILPSWPMPGFFTATLILGRQVAGAAAVHPQGVRRWWVGSTGVVVLLLTVALLHVRFGLVQPLWPPATDPSTQMLDVAQIRQAFREEPLAQALRDSDFVFSNNFFVAGQMVMALHPLTTQPITCFDTDLRGFAYWSRAQDFVGKTGLYLTTAQFENFDRRAIADLARDGEPSLAAELAAQMEGETLPALRVYERFFQNIEAIGEIGLKRAGAVVQTVKVYRATGLQRPYPRPYGL